MMLVFSVSISCSNKDCSNLLHVCIPLLTKPICSGPEASINFLLRTFLTYRSASIIKGSLTEIGLTCGLSSL